MLVELVESAKEKLGSYEKLAEVCEARPNYISDWKAGRRKPSAWQICYMAEIAGLNPADTLFQVLKSLDTEHAEAFEIWRPYGTPYSEINQYLKTRY